MNRFLTFLISVFCLPLWAAPGDITGVEINTNGWAYVYVEEFPTNATFNNGFLNRTNYAGTNEVWFQEPSTTNGLTITAYTLGYSNSVRVQRLRTVYGTKIVRKPYPDHAQSDILTNGASPNIARFHVALSDTIYEQDSNVVATVHTHGFLDGATPCNGVSNLDATNNSDIVEWTTPTKRTRAGYELVSDPMPVSVVAFGHDGIDSVEFVIRGLTSGTVVTGLVTRMKPAYDRNTKGLRWADYTTNFSLSGFTVGEAITVDWTAFPRTGTNYSTFWEKYAPLTDWPARYTNYYGGANVASNIAVVDVATGNDSNGRATNVSPTEVDPAHYFATIPTALHRVGSSNGWIGGTVYVRTGTTNIGGSSPTFSTWRTHPWIRPYPGDTLTIVTNNSTANTLHFGGMLAIRDAALEPTGATAGSLVNNARRIWLTNCTVNSTHGAPFRSTSASSNCVILVEDSLIIRQTGGFRQFSTEAVTYNAIGNNFGTFTHEFQTTLACGNWMTNAASTNMVLTSDSSGVTYREQLIWYNNKFHALYGDATIIVNLGPIAPLTNCAFVQNEFEGIERDGTSCKQFIFSSASQAADRILWQHNTVLGGRGIFAYNTSATGYRWKRLSLRNNGFIINGWVTDNDATLPGSTNIGNWLHIWATGYRGNVIPNTHGSQHGSSEYAHYQSFYRPIAPGKSNAWWRFRSPQWAYSDGSNGDPSPGNGDYRWQSDAPSFFVPTVPLLDYDIDLLPRSKNYARNWDPPGASASGNAKKGNGFF